MSTFSINLYDLDSADTSQANLLTSNPSGAQWDWASGTNPTLTIDAGAETTSVSYETDESGILSDDSNQTLSEDLTLNGTTYPAGTVLQDEYEILMNDDAGNTYTLVAISARVYPTPWYYTDEIIGYTFEGDAPEAGTVLTYAGYGNSTDRTSMVPCFTTGTMIETPTGARPIEDLSVGDLVLTLDHGPQEIRWIGRRSLHGGFKDLAHMRPIRIRAGALGANHPRCDMMVSPQHRVLVQSRIVERMTGGDAVLVAAKHLVGSPGIEIASEVSCVTYIHMMFAAHEIVFADGAAMESLYLGPQARKALPARARAEIFALFPELMMIDGSPMHPARPFVTGRIGRKLAQRHTKNRKTLAA